MTLPRRPGRRPLTALGLVASATVLALAGTIVIARPASATTLGPDGKPVTSSRGVTFGVVAHRGGALERPENSLEAFGYAVAEGFDAIETDLLFTRDGHGVLSHNDTLPARCTNAGRKLHAMTLAQVRQVRCTDFRTGGRTVPIPTFEEFAAVVKDADIGIHLDLKTYRGQPRSEERSNIRRTIALLTGHALLDRTTILTYQWDSTLPTIRRLAPTVRVIAWDNRPMDLGRVRLAARLGADGFGIRASQSPVNLLRYTAALGMDPTPWQVVGGQLQSYAIAFGGRHQSFLTDTPAATRADLLAGRINLDPAARAVVTTLAKKVTVAPKATVRAKQRRYVTILGKAVPAGKLAMLDTVTVRITVTGGRGKGYLYVGAMDSPLSSSVRVRIPRGTKSLTVRTPVGDRGKLRIHASAKLTYQVSVTGYTNLRFD